MYLFASRKLTAILPTMDEWAIPLAVLDFEVLRRKRDLKL